MQIRAYGQRFSLINHPIKRHHLALGQVAVDKIDWLSRINKMIPARSAGRRKINPTYSIPVSCKSRNDL